MLIEMFKLRQKCSRGNAMREKNYKLTELKNTRPPPCAPCVREIYIVTVFKEKMDGLFKGIVATVKQNCVLLWAPFSLPSAII